ncbi:MAG TPA: AAA family ATPase [Streptosporangiaceae bacterium]|nr:AAA family ATPase [Streptosporangiaceae bacterium]
MANHEQDQDGTADHTANHTANHTAGPGRPDGEGGGQEVADEGTFRWPASGLPRLFGQQSSLGTPAPRPPDAAEEDQQPAEAGQQPAEGAQKPAEAGRQPAGEYPAEKYPPVTYGQPAEYDPPDGYPMAEYDAGYGTGDPDAGYPGPGYSTSGYPASGYPAPGCSTPGEVDSGEAAAQPLPLPPETPPHWQPAETADSLTADLLLRGRHAAPPGGWRRVVYQATGGLVRPPQSAAELRRRELVARACTPVAGGHHRVAVLSLKGGVGKTTTVMGLGSTLASLRGDRVIAVDANPDRGTLSDKLRLETAATVRDLLNERDQIQRYADVRAFTTQAASRLEVLASDRDPTVSVAFSDQDYQDVVQVLEHYYSICITDCGTGLLHSAMAGVLRLADQIVLVSSPSVDGARSASATLDWLQAHGYGDLVRDGVVVLSVIRPRSKSTVDLGRLEQHFATRCRAVARIPYDAHLEEGAEVDLTQLSRATADAYLALAAEVGDGFSWPHRPAGTI